MWFKWKKKAIQLQQQNTALQAENAEQLEHIKQLKDALASSQNTAENHQRQLQFNRGVSRNLIVLVARFLISVILLNTSLSRWNVTT